MTRINRTAHKRGRLAAMAVILMVGAACSDAVVQPGPNVPDRVLFVRNRVLMVVNPDGTNEQRFTPDTRLAAHPRLAADGESLFASLERSIACGDIVQLSLDGELMRTLDAGAWCATAPQVSPNMQRVVFLAEQAATRPPKPFVAAMRLDGSQFINLSELLPPPAVGCAPSEELRVLPYIVGWLSDTRVQIKRFASCEGFRWFTINSDGSDAVEQDMGHPSPDGTRTLMGGQGMVVRYRLSGAQSVVSQSPSFVADAGVFFSSPWSADGTHVVYRHFSGGSTYIGKVDGSGEVRVPVSGTLWGFGGGNDRLLYTTDTIVDGLVLRDLYLLVNDGSAPVALSVGKGPVSEALFIGGR